MHQLLKRLSWIYLINLFRLRVLSINGKTQRFSMINPLDRPVINTNFTLCLDPIIISSVLATFKLNLFALSQQVRLLSSEVTVSLRSTIVFADKVILVSSANILGAASHRQFGRSLIYIYKKARVPGYYPAVCHKEQCWQMTDCHWHYTFGSDHFGMNETT